MIKTKTRFPMLRRFILPFFVLISTFAFAQADSSNYFLQKGLDEKQKGRRMESLKDFEKSFKYDSSNKVMLNELASAYLDLRKYYQAKETYKKLVNLGETSPANYKQLIQPCFNLRSYDEAILYANDLKKAAPGEKVNYYLGKINYERENYGDALKYLSEAAKDDPQNAEVYYMMGRSYADMQNYEQAIPLYQRAIELDGTKYGWIYELGMICYANNNNADALKFIQLAGDKGYPKDNGYMQN